MYLRALGSLLTRRISPRGIPRTLAHAQAESSLGIVSQSQAALGAAAARRPARSLHTLRDLATGGDGALGAAAVAALAGFVGLLYYKKATDESAGEVTDKEEVPDKKPISREGDDMDEAAIRAMFVDKDGKLDYRAYLDYINFPNHRDVIPLFNKYYEDHNPQLEWEAAKREPVKDEAAMKARFEDWMRKYNKVYKNEEEKARRYEAFKVTAKWCDAHNAKYPHSAAAPNGLADWTDEEHARYDCHRNFDWEEFLEENTPTKWRVKGDHEVTGCEAVKQVYP